MTAEQAKQDMLQHLDRMLPNTPALAKTAAAPKKARVKPLPPQAAPCGLVMDGDRMIDHRAQCIACAAGVQAQSYAGIDKVQQSPTLSDARLQVMMRHQTYERIAEELSRSPARVPVPAAPVCTGSQTHPSFPCFGPRAMRHIKKALPPQLVCEGHYLHAEALRNTDGLTNVLSNDKHPERIDRRPPPLAHSMGIEDPALPNVWD